MTKTKYLIYIVLIISFSCNNSENPETTGHKNALLTVDQRADDLLNKMTTEEKIAQMDMWGKEMAIMDAVMEEEMESRNSRGEFPLSLGIAVWPQLEHGDKTGGCISRFVVNSPAGNLHNRGSDQPDAGFGFTGGVAESLLQSHAAEISLLRALSNNWPDASVSGLCARGKYEVAIDWNDGERRQAETKSYQGGPCSIHYGNLVKTIDIKAGGFIVIDNGLNKI